MGFSNSILTALKKLGCVSEPRVQEAKYATLPPETEEVEAVQGSASDIHVIDQEKEKVDLKIITVEDRSSSKPKEEEKPKSDEETSAELIKEGESKSNQVAAELIKEEGESKSNQAPAAATVPSQLIEEEQIARKVDAN